MEMARHEFRSDIFTRPAAEARAAARLSDRDFARLSEFISGTIGVKMPEAKRTLLESRLIKRLRALNLRSFDEYCDYLFGGSSADETVHMIDLVVTNKTDFFREPAHFDTLSEKVLPDLMSVGAGTDRPLTVWSAGCSTGEEPYTLAMILKEFAETVDRFDFQVLGTDISTRVLAKASDGIYEEARVAPVPMELRRKYLLRSRDSSKGLVKISPELGSHVRFKRVNLMDEDWDLGGETDIIFCRNVIIYFNRETQEALFRKFAAKLSRGGYIFIGHSETLNGFDLPLDKVAPTVYRKI